LVGGFCGFDHSRSNAARVSVALITRGAMLRVFLWL
jgi:hypothetical protein